MSEIVFSVTPAAVQEVLSGGGEFVPPQRLLSGLTEAQALAVPPGSPYSVGQIVAHMQWWQDYSLAKMRGEPRPRPEHLDDTFAPPAAGTWETLVARFLTGLDDVAALGAERGKEISPGRADADTAFELLLCPVMHSAYHLGQIALLRQIQGFWPPEGGDDSW